MIVAIYPRSFTVFAISCGVTIAGSYSTTVILSLKVILFVNQMLYLILTEILFLVTGINFFHSIVQSFSILNSSVVELGEFPLTS